MAFILVVDDSEMTRTVLQHQLLKLGHDVEAVSSGVEAVVAVGEREFDLVLLDVEMADMDGHAVLAAFKSAGHLEGLPVVVVSGVEDEQQIKQCLNGGAKAFIQKPPKREDLIATIERWVLGSRNKSAKALKQAEEIAAKPSSGIPDVDEEVLRTLPRGIGKETPLERAIRFERMAPRYLSEMKEAAAESDLAAMSKAAGSLRAEAERVGALRLAAMTRAVEEGCDGGRADEALAFTQTVPNLTENSLKKVREMKRFL